MTTARRQLLVAFAGIPWSEVEQRSDSLTLLGRLLEAGVSGRIALPMPPVPELLWTSLATGRSASGHGICHPHCRHAPVPVRAADRTAPAIWNLLDEASRPSLVAGWPVTTGETLRHGHLVPDTFAQGAGLPPEASFPPQLAEMHVLPEEIEDVIVQGFGMAHRPAAVRVLREHLAQDFSIHAAITCLMEEADWQLAVVRYPGVESLAQLLRGLPEGRAVLARYLGLLDALTARLLELSGPDSDLWVLSPFAWQSGSQGPPDAAGWFLAGGPGLARDRLIHGAGLLDFVPSVLAPLGMKLPAEPRARVLLDALADPPELRWCEESPPEHGKSPASCDSPGALEWDWNFARSLLDEGDNERAVPWLVSVSDRFPERAEFQLARFHCEIRLQRLTDAGDTLVLLQEMLEPGPVRHFVAAELALARGERSLAGHHVDAAGEVRGVMRLTWKGRLLLQLKRWAELEVLARRVLEEDERLPQAWIGLGESLLRTRRPMEAVEAAVRALGVRYFLPEAHLLLARSLYAARLWSEARQSLEKLLRIQPGNGLARAYLRRISSDASGGGAGGRAG